MEMIGFVVGVVVAVVGAGFERVFSCEIVIVFDPLPFAAVATPRRVVGAAREGGPFLPRVAVEERRVGVG